MPSAIADTTESLNYGFARDLAKACDAALERRDPKGAKARKARSSYHRGMQSWVRSLSDEQITAELWRRARARRRRQQATERQRALRARRKRAKSGR